METETKTNLKTKPECKPEPVNSAFRGSRRRKTRKPKKPIPERVHNLSESELKEMSLSLPTPNQRRMFVRHCLFKGKDPNQMMAMMQKTIARHRKRSRRELTHGLTEKQHVTRLSKTINDKSVRKEFKRQVLVERKDPYELIQMHRNNAILNKNRQGNRPNQKRSEIQSTSAWAHSDDQPHNNANSAALTNQCLRLLSNIGSLGTDIGTNPLALPGTSDGIGPFTMPLPVTSGTVPVVSVEQEYVRFLSNIHSLKTLEDTPAVSAPSQSSLEFDQLVELQTALLEQEKLGRSSPKLQEDVEPRSAHFQSRRRSPNPSMADCSSQRSTFMTESFSGDQPLARISLERWEGHDRSRVPTSQNRPPDQSFSGSSRNDPFYDRRQQTPTRTPPRSWEVSDRTRPAASERFPLPSLAGSFRRNDFTTDELGERRCLASADEAVDDQERSHTIRSSTPTSKRNSNDPETPRHPLFIVPVRYPSQRLSDEEMDQLENSILQAILQTNDDMKPAFHESFRSHGRYGVICIDQFSESWLHRYLTTFELRPNTYLKIIKLDSAKIRAIAELPLSKKDDSDVILKFIAKQNSNLDTSSWKVVQRWDGGQSTSITFLVDEDSAKKLRERGKVNFKMGTAQIVVKDEVDDGVEPSRHRGRTPEIYHAGRTRSQDRRSGERNYHEISYGYSTERGSYGKSSEVTWRQHYSSNQDSQTMIDVTRCNQLSEPGISTRNQFLESSRDGPHRNPVDHSGPVERWQNVRCQQPYDVNRDSNLECGGLGSSEPSYGRDQNHSRYRAEVPTAGGSISMDTDRLSNETRDRWTRDPENSHEQPRSRWSSPGRDRPSGANSHHQRQSRWSSPSRKVSQNPTNSRERRSRWSSTSGKDSWNPASSHGERRSRWDSLLDHPSQRRADPHDQSRSRDLLPDSHFRQRLSTSRSDDRSNQHWPRH